MLVTGHQQSPRSFGRWSLTAALLCTAVATAAHVGASHDAARAAAGTITGTVYQDYNSNGSNDTADAAGQAKDLPIAGVTIRAFDSSGAQVGSATSGNDGTYSLSVSSAATTSVRVEFVLPSSGELSTMQPSFAGTQNGTTVRFVDVGSTGVDMGYSFPGEYCQNNPYIAVSRLCAGTGTAMNSAPTIFVTKYDGGPYDTTTALTDGFTSWAQNSAATKSVTGSVLGMAWDRSSGRVYSSAYVRRHADMYEVAGVPKPGALFVTTPAGTKSPGSTGGTTSFLVDLETLIPGTAQFSNPNSAGPGYIPSNASRKIDRMMDGTSDGGNDDDGVDSNLVSGQVGVFEEVGVTGIGDIETDNKGTLWVVSLYDRNLYAVTLPPDGSAPTTMESWGNIASQVTCTNGEARPFSVRLWRGSLYLGVVCDGSGDFNPADPLPSTVPNSHVTFTILKRSINRSGGFSTFFGPHPLNNSGRISKGTTQRFNTEVESRTWNPWTNFYPSKSASSDMQRYNQRPTPLLSEIEFDRDGSMILGFRDRTADQSSTNGSETPTGGYTGFPTVASGDIYRVCRVGSGYASSDYVFEGEPGYPTCAQTVGRPNDGTEYYSADAWSFIPSGQSNWVVDHGEISAGMLLQVPGFPDVIASGFDPYTGPSAGRTTYYAGGIRYFNNANGKAYGNDNPAVPNQGGGVMFYSHTTEPLSLGGFQKVNGMADIEALCDEAPLQIGNRVWIDTDKDGIQDPGETPVAGVTVRLYNSAGTLVGTAITNSAGVFYFASNTTESAAGDGDNTGGGLVVGQPFTIKLDKAADYSAGGPLDGYGLTSTNSTTTVSTDTDGAIDNDGSLVGGSTYGVDRFPAISVAAHGPGMNDHTFDFGFYLLPINVSVGDYVWWDVNRDGIQDDRDIPIAGVTLSLTNADGSPVTDTNGKAVTTTKTDSKGKYTFENLPPGRYKVAVSPPAGAKATVAGAGTDPALDSSTDSALSRTMTTNGDRDPTLDFGFYKPSVSVGNRVWLDKNGDGIKGPEDTGLAGFTLTLFSASGKPVTDVYGRPVAKVVTGPDGSYSFGLLPPGQYRVQITYPKGYLPTKEGTGKTKNSWTLFATSKVLAAGQSDTGLNFGLVSRPGETFEQVLPATL